MYLLNSCFDFDTFCTHLSKFDLALTSLHTLFIVFHIMVFFFIRYKHLFIINIIIFSQSLILMPSDSVQQLLPCTSFTEYVTSVSLFFLNSLLICINHFVPSFSFLRSCLRIAQYLSVRSSQNVQPYSYILFCCTLAIIHFRTVFTFIITACYTSIVH